LLQNPYRDQYAILKMETADLAAIVRVVQRGSLTMARLLSFSGYAEDDALLSRFLGSLVKWALDSRMDLIYLVSGDPSVVRMARRWFPRQTSLRLAFYCNQPEGWRLLQGGDHLWELIDSDFDFLV
jgi:hypothetical protein